MVKVLLNLYHTQLISENELPGLIVTHEPEASPAIHLQVLPGDESGLWRCQHTSDLQVCLIE